MTKKFESANSPFTSEGKNYHLGINANQIASTVLLPGDPKRVNLISKEWDSYSEVGNNREFVTHSGKIYDLEISAVSTGIGNPAMATVVESLKRMDVKTLIRVGTTGSIQEGIECGHLIIAQAAVRLDGASKAYVMPEYPASAHYEGLIATIQACEELGYSYHVGITASTDSWYLGQARPGYRDYYPTHAEFLMRDLQMAGVLNFEMETSALYTLSNLYNIRSVAVFAVVANRITNTIEVTGIEKAISVGNMAAQILQKMDKQKNNMKKSYWYPALIKG